MRRNILCIFLSVVCAFALLTGCEPEPVAIIEAASVQLDKTELAVGVGKTLKLTASVLPADAADKTVTWISEDPAIATVDDVGKVTGMRTGKTVVTAVTRNGMKAECTVYVSYDKVDAVAIAEKLEVGVGKTAILDATFTPLHATVGTGLTWSTADSSIASVDADGKVSGVRKGFTVITVKTESGLTDTCTVFVDYKPIEKIAFKQDAFTLNKGEAVTLEFAEDMSLFSSPLSWESSDTKVAAVLDGKVTAVGAGKADITVKTTDFGKTAVCHITVPEFVLSSSAPIAVEKGKTLKLNYINNTGKEVAPAWKSADETIATVDGGTVRGIATGQVKITMTMDGKNLDFIVNVADIVVSDYGQVGSRIRGLSLDGDGRLSVGGLLNRDDLLNIKSIANLRHLDLRGAVIDENTIPKSVFEGKRNLETVRLPEGLESIGPYAFKSTGLVEVNFPGTLKKIDIEAFHSTRLKNVYIPSSITFGRDVFNSCKELESVEFEAGRTSVPASMFVGAEVKKVILPDSITTIEAHAFNGAKVDEMAIPAGLKKIDAFAFSSSKTCLTDNIDHQDWDLGEKAFFKTEIGTLHLYDGMKIGRYAFEDSTVTRIVVHGSELDIARNGSWGFCNGLKVDELVFDGPAKVQDRLFLCDPGHRCFINRIVFGDKVTSIGEKAFLNNLLGNNIEIPGNVTSIGIDAFYDVDIVLPDDAPTDTPKTIKLNEGLVTLSSEVFAQSEITAIALPSTLKHISEKTFASCKGLVDVDLNSVETIAAEAFAGSGLKSIRIPSSLKSLEKDVFKGCNITAVDISNCTRIPDYLYWNMPITELTIPASVNELGSHSMSGTKLASISLPENVKIIASEAFDGVATLETIDLGKVREIGANAFRGTGLTSVTIPDTVTSIGTEAFEGLSNLTAVTFGTCSDATKLETIGDRAFQGTGLTAIAIPASLKSIGSSAFQNAKIASLTIPGNVKTIRDGAFRGNSKLVTLVLEEGIEIIDGAAFESTAIESLTVPKSVKSLDGWTFNGCSNLKSVKLNEGLLHIAAYAFKNCNALESIVMPASLETLHERAFDNAGIKDITFLGAPPARILTVTDNGFDIDDNDSFWNARIHVHFDRMDEWKKSEWIAGPLDYGDKRTKASFKEANLEPMAVYIDFGTTIPTFASGGTYVSLKFGDDKVLTTRDRFAFEGNSGSIELVIDGFVANNKGLDGANEHQYGYKAEKLSSTVLKVLVPAPVAAEKWSLIGLGGHNQSESAKFDILLTNPLIP